MSSALGTMGAESYFASRMRMSAVPEKAGMPLSDGCRNQRREEKSASGEPLCGMTLNHPLTPQASAMRPTSMASGGSSAASSPTGSSALGRPGMALSGGRGLLGGLLEQALDRRRRSRADAAPVSEAVLR